MSGSNLGLAVDVGARDVGGGAYGAGGRSLLPRRRHIEEEDDPRPPLACQSSNLAGEEEEKEPDGAPWDACNKFTVMPNIDPMNIQQNSPQLQ